MVLTILEAQVEHERAAVLEQAFREVSQQLPPQIVESFLVRDTADPTVWRIMTLWRSHEALEEYRRSSEVPGGIRMFRAAEAEPELSVFEVVGRVVGEER